MCVNRPSLEIFFILTETDQNTFFHTFPGWKMTKLFSILFQTPQEPCIYHTFFQTPRQRLNLTQGSHVLKLFFHIIWYLFNTKLKNFHTITYLHFSKNLLMEHNAKIICKTVVSGKEQNLNEQMAEFVISILFQYFCTFWPNWTLIQGLEKRFHNSILFQYFQYRVAVFFGHRQKWNGQKN